MKRKISLYIADRRVDLDDESLILLNYAFEDLYNPTIVKNSYSQQVTLKGTPVNNSIFGDIFSLDRRIAYGKTDGSGFNPSQKVPFEIHDDLGNILEGGYMKLDSVTRQGRRAEYKVSLYGGLGSFLYSLSYDQNGNKKTLASLEYLNTGNSKTELNFPINAENVVTAWNTENEGDIDSIWKVINFAPCFNGIPSSNFSANKAIVPPASVGLAPSKTEGGVTYGSRDGYCLVNLAESHDEWAVKDMRSYLQRPVFSIRALWEAVARPQNNGGYEVDMSGFEDMGNFPVGAMWMTLPLLSSITEKTTAGDLSLSPSYSSASQNNYIERVNVNGSISSGTKVMSTINARLLVNMPSSATASKLYRYCDYRLSSQSTLMLRDEIVIFAQAIAYASDNSVVGGSAVKSFFKGSGQTSKEMASLCNFVPLWTNAGYEDNDETDTFTKISSSKYRFDKEMSFYVESNNVSYYKVFVYAYTLRIEESFGLDAHQSSRIIDSDSLMRGKNLFSSKTSRTPFAITTIGASAGSANSVNYTASASLRSNAIVTKDMLLSTTNTPAEYILSLCKMFGICMTYDCARKKVSFLRRNDLFIDETIDLSDRVDVSKPITILPFAFDSKWYQFGLSVVEGEYAKQYKDTWGLDYGVQKIDTGYDFNADTKNLLDGNVFKAGVTIIGKGKYFNLISQGGNIIPSPFIDKGNTYTLWSATGETKNIDISCPSDSAEVTYFNDNPDHEGWDIETARRLNLCGADGKGVDGSGILVFFEGYNNYPFFKVTDDEPIMDVLNDGVPCWILSGGSGSGIQIPAFGRYRYLGSTNGTIRYSLDFGRAKELFMPSVYSSSAVTLYERFWKGYLADRYDNNTKVMTCKVSFKGMKVDQSLLRKFYWFENSLWVLNKMTNYSLTTDDSVECEFVQVQDKNNYLNGQE